MEFKLYKYIKENDKELIAYFSNEKEIIDFFNNAYELKNRTGIIEKSWVTFETLLNVKHFIGMNGSILYLEEIRKQVTN